MKCLVPLVSIALTSIAFAEVRSGKAEAGWVSASATYEPARPVRTAVRVVLDEGWHTYWLNPGEGGMRISIKWELPAGWVAGELEHPVPLRFESSGLAGFGYKGTVLFPGTFTPPLGAAEVVTLVGKISWLTCNDDSCVPGDATLRLTLAPGAAAPTPEAAAIQEAGTKIPRPAPEGFRLDVVEHEKTLTLNLTAPDGWDPRAYQVFPATPQAVDSAARLEFAADGKRWKAEVPRSDYASRPLRELSLVFAGDAAHPPFVTTWRAP